MFPPSEWVEGCSLEEIVDQQGTGLWDELVKFYLAELCVALQQLHEVTFLKYNAILIVFS